MQSADTTPEPWHFLGDDFWGHYVASLRAKQVKPTAIRWHVVRAEHYLQAISRKRLAEHIPQDVADYLEKLGRRGRLTGNMARLLMLYSICASWMRSHGHRNVIGLLEDVRTDPSSAPSDHRA